MRLLKRLRICSGRKSRKTDMSGYIIGKSSSRVLRCIATTTHSVPWIYILGRTNTNFEKRRWTESYATTIV